MAETNLVPSTLYKYQSFNYLSLSNLRNRHLWFSLPTKFDDPFDCALSLDVRLPELSDGDVNRIVAHEAGSVLPRTLLDKEGNERSWRECVESVFQKFVRLAHEDVRNRFGVCCLTAKGSDLLMWPHYADSHRGFCLEFHRVFPPFASAKWVEYPKEPTPDLVAMMCGDDPAAYMAEWFICTKHHEWSYQQEWRIFSADKADSLIDYPSNSLKAVYLGVQMQAQHKEEIAGILQGSTTKLYEMRRSDSGFSIEPDQEPYGPTVKHPDC